MTKPDKSRPIYLHKYMDRLFAVQRILESRIELVSLDGAVKMICSFDEFEKVFGKEKQSP